MTAPDPVAEAAMRYLLSGDLQRDLEEVRQHLAAVERTLPRADQMRLADKFGALLKGTA